MSLAPPTCDTVAFSRSLREQTSCPWALRTIVHVSDPQLLPELIVSELGGTGGAWQPVHDVPQQLAQFLPADLAAQFRAFFARSVLAWEGRWTSDSGWFQSYRMTLSRALVVCDTKRVGLIGIGESRRRLDVTFEPIDIQALRDGMMQREAGTADCQVRRYRTTLQAPRDIADAFLQDLGLTPLGRSWSALSPDEATAILTNLLQFDMAYGATAMPSEEADRLTQTFVRLFAGTTVFLCNGHWSDRRLRGWTPMTDSTFDSGVAAVDAGRHLVGLAWFTDED